MNTSIVPAQTLSLTALIHSKTKRKKIIWEAACPELDITVNADDQDTARDSLHDAVQGFLNTASAKEIESRLAKGTTHTVEPLSLAAIVRAEDDEQANWLQRGTGGAIALVGSAKDKSGDLAATVAGAASNSGRFVAGTAANSGRFVAGTATHVYGAVGGVATNTYQRTQDAAKKTVPLLIGLTEHAGIATDAITQNPTLQQVAETFKLEQWLDVSGQIDIEEAEQAVAGLRESYPEESNRQIARRLITHKAVYAGGVGLATSLLPGAAVPLLALDMAATASLQAELIFQIAAAYGLDLEDPARKGEMLAVFGCVLGGSKAVKAGLGVLRNAPVAGAVIGATSNAAMIYALGNVACSFYEKRLDLEASPEDLQAVKTENALYLEASTEQQVIADKVLMHIWRASEPTASKEQTVNALRELNFSSASVEIIGISLDAPAQLEELLPLLDNEFAHYVSTRAQQIAEMDSVITDEEAEVLAIIANHFADRSC